MHSDDWNLAAATKTAKNQIADKQYFFSEKLPDASRNLCHVYAPVEKCKISFENKNGYQISSFASSIVKLDDGKYRFYATTYDAVFSWMRISIWDSYDGLNWKPQSLGQAGFDGDNSNFIKFAGVEGKQDFVGQPQVVRLRNGRWRMYFWKHRDNHVRYITAVSEDGLKWKVEDINKPVLYHPGDEGFAAWAAGLTVNKASQKTFTGAEVIERKRLSTNDATYVYYNSLFDRFECYSVWLHLDVPSRRVTVDNAPGIQRIIHRRFSEDGLIWSDPEIILIPDNNDPWDLQFYFLATQFHDDWMIGSLGHYRVEDKQQSMDIELCFSRDGYKWERPLRGAFIKRGAEGTKVMDSAGIYAPNAWIDRNDKWLCLYSGTPNMHNDSEHNIGVMGATFGKNRFVGLGAGKVKGGFMSDAFILHDNEIKIDADIRGGLKAELCDGFGNKFEGFNLKDSIEVKGNGIHSLKWSGKEDIACLRYLCFRLRFEYEDGEMYNIQF